MNCKGEGAGKHNCTVTTVNTSEQSAQAASVAPDEGEAPTSGPSDTRGEELVPRPKRAKTEVRGAPDQPQDDEDEDEEDEE